MFAKTSFRPVPRIIMKHNICISAFKKTVRERCKDAVEKKKQGKRGSMLFCILGTKLNSKDSSVFTFGLKKKKEKTLHAGPPSGEALEGQIRSGTC
jgi:hypothetical protein